MTRPVCRPLRLPVTESASSCAGVAPRKLMVVFGEAVGVPGEGNTLTEPDARTAAGRGLGRLRVAPAAPHPAVPSATTSARDEYHRVRCILKVVSAFLWND